MASGYRAEILPMVCEVYLKARDADALPSNQRHVAVQAEILIRALAHVGIIALGVCLGATITAVSATH